MNIVEVQEVMGVRKIRLQGRVGST